MEAAMLLDNATAIDGDDQTVGESLSDEPDGNGVKIRLGIDGTEHSHVDEQEVGIGSRPAGACLRP